MKKQREGMDKRGLKTWNFMCTQREEKNKERKNNNNDNNNDRE